MSENSTITLEPQQMASPEHLAANVDTILYSAEKSAARKTAALVLGMEAVGLAVDGSLKIASAYMPLLEGLAARELIAGGGDLAVIGKIEGTRQKISKRLGSTALMVGTAYTSSRTGLGMAEAAGVHSGLQLFGVQVASKAAGLSAMNVLRSRKQQSK